MIKIAICDENIQDRQTLKCYIKNFNQKYEIPAQIYEYESGKSFLEQLKEDPYHIVFLDVDMKECSGIELARQVRVCNRQATLIFVTHTTEYALMGYKVHVYDYLLKPLDAETFNLNLKDIYKHLETHYSKNNIYIFPTTQGSVKLDLSHILYAESNHRKTTIHLEDHDYICHHNINKLEEMLAFEGFIRTHRSFIVNSKKVKEIKSSEVILEDGTSVFLSKYKQKAVRERLSKSLEIRM